MNDAAALVSSAKKWASYYGEHANGRAGAVLTAPLRVRAAWDAGDADALAAMFLDNGSMLLGDRQLTSRAEIRDYLAEAFAGGYRGSRLVETVRDITELTGTVAVAVGESAIVPAGQDEPAADAAQRTMWVVVQHDGDWRVASWQSSPVTG
ncbi:SgcJ/EcaC family oxidoreductase [Actinoplanes sp. N902-109]|uniref:SgcJ/EcaC family oxidoreductase n=1 Tax=Actinoplanes sp. (strain N902-109) TaxID=649831 RepID=UPI0003294635|nr:SgcJ/EcaC family oxidoreductase [Actinoplanes sp. N902-109]AGL16703.1 hypothetical protein L083_3193 [Actinoplanes sp. N902-109]